MRGLKGNSRVVFVTEGGGSIGFGHLMRCVNLARALNDELKLPVSFLVNRDQSVAGRLEREGFPYSFYAADRLGSCGRVSIDGAAAVIDTIADVGRIVKGLKDEGKKVILISNHSQWADKAIYPTAALNSVPALTHAVSGGDWVIIGKGFREARAKSIDKGPLTPLRVLVTFGASDPNRLTEKVLEGLKGADGIEVAAVIGPSFKDRERLMEIAAGSNARALENIDDLAPLMAASHIAFTAYGTTVYELAYMGVPAVVIANYTTDRADLDELQGKGLCMNLGRFNDVTGADIRAAVEKFKDHSFLESFSKGASALLDGTGSARIARLVAALIKDEDGVGLFLRVADLSDSDMLLEWRNDPVTRANSIDTGEIERPTHEAWLEKTLADPSVKLLVAELDGEPVGVVRLVRKDGCTELSWTVAPGARGRGIGKTMVRMALEMAEDRSVTAVIRPENTASVKIAEANGFRLERRDGAFTYWVMGKAA